MDASRPGEGLTVVVVAGAGARGAYEAAALAEILPVICPNGLANTILLGTSAGAINVALWAARAKPGRDLRIVGEEVKQVWRQIHRKDVYEIPWCGYLKTGGAFGLDTAHAAADGVINSVSGAFSALTRWIPKPPKLPSVSSAAETGGDAARWLTDRSFDAAGLLARHPLAATGALLDTHPLKATAKRRVKFAALHDNIRDRAIAGAGVVATSCPQDASGGRSRVFLELHPDIALPGNEEGAIDYVPTELSVEHVLASAAIPVVFPPVKIRTPKKRAGWYTDGGVRLNVPIEPAIKLGADRIVVISSHATEYPDADDEAAAKVSRPGIFDIGAQAIHATLADGMIEDLRSLRRINKIVADSRPRVLYSATGRPYREVTLLDVSPENGKLSSLAAKVANDPKGAIDRALLRFAFRFGGRGGRNELLSYLLFEPAYFKEQFTLGSADALAQLARHPELV